MCFYPVKVKVYSYISSSSTYICRNISATVVCHVTWIHLSRQDGVTIDQQQEQTDEIKTSRKDPSATTHSTTSQKDDAKSDVREPCGTRDKPVSNEHKALQCDGWGYCTTLAAKRSVTMFTYFYKVIIIIIIKEQIKVT